MALAQLGGFYLDRFIQASQPKALLEVKRREGRNIALLGNVPMDMQCRRFRVLAEVESLKSASHRRQTSSIHVESQLTRLQLQPQARPR